MFENGSYMNESLSVNAVHTYAYGTNVVSTVIVKLGYENLSVWWCVIIMMQVFEIFRTFL
jgi:hypothetical protein